MPEVWFALKKSFACTKSFLCDVHEPQVIGDSNADETIQREMHGCLRSTSNLRGIVCGSKRRSEKPPVGSSSRSIVSSEILDSIIHEIEAQINKDNLSVSHEGKARLKPDSTFMEFHTLSGPGGKTRISNFVTRKGRPSSATSDSDETVVSSNPWESMMKNQFIDRSKSICQECGGVFKNLDAVESHHLSKHAVTELDEGDSARKVIELICQRSWLKSRHECGRIEKVFKVHNLPKTLSWFEEHREMVRSKATKLQKENPRCLVDGNELLRFHGTTLACSPATNGSQILCNLDSCGVCQILRHGFAQKEGNDGTGVFACATSGKALESIVLNEEDGGSKKALMVCRVIAGRISNRCPEKAEGKDDSGFDSSGIKLGQNSKFEELYVLNPRAVLPCFVVTYKQ